jgi:hypothetical protein
MSPGGRRPPRLSAQSPGGLADRIIANTAELRAACRQAAGQARNDGLACRQPSRSYGPAVPNEFDELRIGCAGSLMLATGRGGLGSSSL